MKKEIIIKTVVSSLMCMAVLPVFSKKINIHDFTVTEKDFVDTIPITFKYNKIFFPVIINDHTYHFIFDTGSDIEAINESAGIDCQKLDVTAVASDASGVNKRKQIVRMPDLQIGKLHIQDMKAIVLGKSALDCYNDGLIGFNLIRKKILVKVDISNKRMILTDRKHFFDNEQGTVVKYEDQGTPIVPFTLSHFGSDYAIFDTGRVGLLDLNKDLYDFILKKNTKKKKSNADFLKQIVWKQNGTTGYSVNGNAPESEINYIDAEQLFLGGIEFDHAKINTRPGFCGFGSEVLKYGSMLFNPYKKSMTFQPYGNTSKINITEKAPNIVFSFQKEKIVIGTINPQSDPYKQGARQGDVVVELNDKAIDDVCTFYGMTWNILRQPTYKMKLKLRDAQGNVKSVTVEKKEDQDNTSSK